MTTPEEHISDETRALIDEYEQFLSGKARGTINAYLRTVRHLIRWLARLSGNEDRFEPRQLTQRAVEQYLAHLEQEGLSLAHRARVKSSISNFAQFLIEEKGLLRRNPTRGIDLPPVPQPTHQQLSREQRSILCSLVEQEADLRGAALFALSYWAGCRVSEVSWLEVAHTHIGPEDGWLHVGYDEKKWRDIDLMNEARASLYAYMQATHESERTYVFTSQRSERLTEQGIYYWFRTLKAQATGGQELVIADLTFHDLRRDFAYRAREAGWSPEEVTHYLGGVMEQGVHALQTVLDHAQVSREQIKAKLVDIKG